MRFEGLRARNIGVLTDVSLDLTALPGRLVAVTGPNGAGKSTLLGLLAGAMYRDVPTRGTLASLARSRDSFVEVKFVNGSNWTLRHNVDSVTGSGDSVVLDAAGAPAFDSAKRRAFDAWASKHLPAQEVLYGSVFSAQQSAGFLDMKPADRKACLLKVLGVERLEALAEIARAHGREAKVEAAKLRGRLQALAGTDPEEALAELEQADRALHDAEAALVEARAADEAAKAYVGTLRRLREVRGELGLLRTKRANNAALLPDADRIRRAVARAGDIREQHLPALDADLEEIARQLAAVDADRRETIAVHEAAERRLAESRRAVAAADRVLVDEAVIANAVRDLPGVRAAVEHTAEEEAAAKAAVDALASSLIDGASVRIRGLRAGLTKITTIEMSGEHRAVANRALADDDAAAVEIETGPTRLQTARLALASGAQLLQREREGLARVERLAARAGELDGARRAKEEVTAAVQATEAEITSLAHKKAALEDSRRAITGRQDEKGGARLRLRQELEDLASDIRKAPHLETAEARIAEIDPQIAKLEGELVDLEAVPAVDFEIDHVSPAETRAAACRARRERASLALEQAKKTSTERGEVEALLEAAEAEVADYALLADSLGKDGLQIAEVDAAAPELTAQVNDLLHTCVGPRWTVSIDAARASADGKKEIAGITVRVLDTVRNREADGETLSGGERVVVNEAISLALTMLACRQAGAERPTIVRDESGAALDTENTRAWIAMLRRAAEIVDADKVLFVSHSKEAQDLADARIVVDDGKVRVAA